MATANLKNNRNGKWLRLWFTVN